MGLYHASPVGGLLIGGRQIDRGLGTNDVDGFATVTVGDVDEVVGHDRRGNGHVAAAGNERASCVFIDQVIHNTGSCQLLSA